jgi:hypothetical protein
MNRCRGLHEILKDTKNLKKKISGYYQDPETLQTIRASYDNHKFCNECKIAIPKKGHSLSNTKKCPCCKADFRTKPHANNNYKVHGWRYRSKPQPEPKPEPESIRIPIPIPMPEQEFISITLF